MESHVKNEAELLSEKGHEVKVVTIAGELNNSKRIENGVEVHRVNKREFLTWGSGSEDLIVVHQYRHPLSDIAGYFAGHPKIKRIHGIYPPKSSFDSIKKRFYDFFGNKILNDFEVITALSETQKSQLEKIGVKDDKIEIVPNAVNAEKWLEDLERIDGDFKEEYEINTKHFGIVVGRLDWNKGIEDFVKAVRYIVEDNLSFIGVVIGPDPKNLKNGFEKMSKKLGVSENVIFTGKVPFKDLVLAYKQADLLLLPSFYEGFPTVVMEAMLSQTPVIATPNGGTKHLVKEGETGYLCEYGNPSSIYQKIKYIVKVGREENVVENAYFLVKNKYTWSNLIERLEEIYMDVVEDSD
ncbi:hypothetical protein AKJ47_01345 [candidate division MSBL1 archaeon SCGC-AAA261G05]|uniref:Glycosyl transferase family 1 n=1 Tax=candidate division MSBL1 archaeon SCGC-AAA261G05 TaxID=1698276 RepID=A0A133VC18_9EURY|nr:hypothetical protein AKJ47_01345 [candidate division MSBL1 archaeon SCGC-AAA261G05]